MGVDLGAGGIVPDSARDNPRGGAEANGTQRRDH